MKLTSPGPFLHSGVQASHYAWHQVWCLLPAALWGVYRYGYYALVVLAVAVVAAVITDWLASRLRSRRPAIGQALLIGLVIGMCSPPEVPLLIPAVAAVSGVILGYALLGGPSLAWLHPAGLGLIVAILSWPKEFLSLTVHTASGTVANSALSGWYNILAVTPLPGQTPSDAASFFASAPAGDVLAPLNNWFHTSLHLPVPDQLIAGFFGFSYGAIGLSSPILLLIGSIFMFGRGVGDWRTSAAAFASFSVLAWLFGGLAWGLGLAKGEILFFVFNGGFILVLCFLMQHTAALPLTRTGRLWYGTFLGFVLWLVLVFGRLELGAIVALVFANLFAPLIDARFRNRRPAKASLV